MPDHLFVRQSAVGKYLTLLSLIAAKITNFGAQASPMSNPKKAKKSYGQHFLRNEGIARKIAKALSGYGDYENVLEVGPGTGVLTQFLIDRLPGFKAVEADQDLIEPLSAKFPEMEGHIILGDFLKQDLARIFDGQAFGLIGNFPYNISSQIVFRMLKYKDLIPEMVGMFQKEMGDRIVSPPGSKQYGVISVLTQAFYTGEALFNVDRNQFSPPPKVESVVIRLRRKENFEELCCNEALFKAIVKAAFNQRRKMIRNSLKPWLNKLDNPFHPLLEQRPEQLGLQEFVELTNWVEFITKHINDD